MKWWIIGGVSLFFCCYFLAGPIFRAMKKHDYDTMYHGMRDARKAGGSFVPKKDKRYISYSDKYAYGVK